MSRSINFPNKYILIKLHNDVGLCLIIQKKKIMYIYNDDYDDGGDTCCSRLLLRAAVQRKL